MQGMWKYWPIEALPDPEQNLFKQNRLVMVAELLYDVTRVSLVVRATVTLVMLVISSSIAIADVDLPSKFSNLGGIANTRHNLTQSTIGVGAVTMNQYRNSYGEVCVYCHTPHGANTQIDLPLWNRTFIDNSYKTYDTLRTNSLTQAVTAPGINSLACLSCHDGTLAVDTIINMPGSGNFDAMQEIGQKDSFLNDNWDNAEGADASVHMSLSNGECLACHSADYDANPVAAMLGGGATSFDLFVIGTDLTNDHPVGVSLPVKVLGIDFNDPSQTKANDIAFYDLDGDGRPDKDEIRYYNTGDGFEVECSSCHDPHGVPLSGAGSEFIPSFLRRANDNSDVCLTCHIR
jgi:mono/diheme cytochrome c family protein